jgi:hexosaminidase
VGWDEILEGGLARGATVMSWRGEEGGITAANAGHDVVMAPHQHTYLNYQQTREDSTGIHHGDYLPLTRVYGYEPVPAAIDPDKAQHVLGAQAQLWSEFIPDSLRMEYMAYPRLCALSEVVWTPAAKKDIDSFMTRIQTHLQRLDRLGVNYCKQIE